MHKRRLKIYHASRGNAIIVDRNLEGWITYLVDGGRDPKHFPVGIDEHIRFVADLVVAVGAEREAIDGETNSESRQTHLLVEEDDVGLPDFVWGKTEHADASVIGLVPLQLIVLPHLERFLNCQ